MTRTLILTRHAKSSWQYPFVQDHDRPLNKRGRKSATEIGRWLQSNGWLPDEVISSTAQRTRETWNRLGLSTSKLSFTPGLYLAGPDQMFEALSSASAKTVLILGHNPGIAEFAHRLVRQAPNHPRFYDYPTGATTVIHFEAPDWTSVRWGSGEVAGFTIPRELLE
ncbi:SixA phosphatase family protein [Ruegeria conchae]|uniref:SixA phosphatase family protein n=1 Tax=Ruegeria conchae TaxID=981384 RepID=UPI0029C94239|nr:histidine phosphatase family protein [Ruegeria conchae]